jgi:hypothetical protein
MAESLEIERNSCSWMLDRIEDVIRESKSSSFMLAGSADYILGAIELSRYHLIEDCVQQNMVLRS